MKFFSKKNFKTIFILAALFAFLLPNLYFIMPVKAESLQDEYNDLQNQLDALNKQKSDLQSELDSNNYTIEGYNSQASSLLGQAKLLQQNIDGLKLQIDKLQAGIDLLDQQIKKQQDDIKKSEDTIAGLDQESTIRLQNTYMNYRLYGTVTGGNTVFAIDNINSYFKDSQYKEIIQSGTNNLLVKVANLKVELAQKKADLDVQLTTVKKDKEALDIQKSDLDKQEQDVNIKIDAYYKQANALQSANSQVAGQLNDVGGQATQTQAQINKLGQELLNSYVPTDEGQYVVTGTFIGNQGCTGLCTGPHLHFSVCDNNLNYCTWNPGSDLKNPCDYLNSNKSLPDGYGDTNSCGGGGSLAWPLNPVVYESSTFGPRTYQDNNGNWVSDFHTGIDIIGSVWNAPVFAAHDGYVHKVWDDGYGAHYIELCANSNCVGLKTYYWHLSSF